METRKGVHPASGPNPTIQADRQHTDINLMSEKYLKTRLGGNPNGRKPMFIDVPSLSYHEMLNKVVKIQSDFDSLPARLRGRFHNNPTTMLAFIEQPENRRECVKLGLIDDPELKYQIEMESKLHEKVKQEKLFNEAKLKADDESNPHKKASSEAQAP